MTCRSTKRAAVSQRTTLSVSVIAALAPAAAGPLKTQSQESSLGADLVRGLGRPRLPLSGHSLDSAPGLNIN